MERIAPGIKPGDVIVSINGESLKGKNFQEATTVLQSAARPLTLELVAGPPPVVRKQEPYTVTFEGKQLGLGLQPLPPRQQEVERFRVQVENLVAGTVAEKCTKISAGELL